MNREVHVRILWEPGGETPPGHPTIFIHTRRRTTFGRRVRSKACQESQIAGRHTWPLMRALLPGASTATSLDAQSNTAGKYRNVPGLGWLRVDAEGRTCGDGRGWTGCLLIACKRCGVRIPIAPPQIKT